ncbi:hypothetical protein [Marinococcus sp. PL1-022]|uniref:hypothetical protein n=1 Tax=Marinococcus sp. PL1-022 TaxID=3095363 RepID=UPI0029C471AD|nr:hypothetical protein [Marinococcus sp. PL1-022]MDX6153588.1 hypothetical protein [Marinococcus sp. PL1-022]
MVFDFDPMSTLDMNNDFEIDETDLQSYEFQNNGSFSINDLDNDNIMDKIDTDLNNDGEFDSYQSDIDHNGLIDSMEQDFGMTEVNYDINGDGNIDHIDQTLLKEIYEL